MRGLPFDESWKDDFPTLVEADQRDFDGKPPNLIIDEDLPAQSTDEMVDNVVSALTLMREGQEEAAVKLLMATTTSHKRLFGVLLSLLEVHLDRLDETPVHLALRRHGIIPPPDRKGLL